MADETPTNPNIIYSSHPIQSLQLGPYVFENTLLTLKPDEAEEFDAFLATLPASETSRITRIDPGRVAAIVASQSNATQQFDSSAGREALVKLQAENPVVGTKPLGLKALLGAKPATPAEPETPAATE